MKLTTELKKKIDNLNYKDMLTLHRFEPLGSKLFEGESADYFYLKFNRLKKKLSNKTKVQVSKQVGWDDKEYRKNTCYSFN